MNFCSVPDLKYRDGESNGWLEFAGLENDGVEQEQTYNTAYDEKL